MQVAQERVGGLLAEVGFDAPKGQVHVRQPPRRRIGFLAEDGDVGAPAAVGLGEALRLYEHAAGAAAGVVDAAAIRLQHLDQHADDAARRVELAAELALGRGELAEEVFVHPPQPVSGLGPVVLEADAGDQVDKAAHAFVWDAAAGVVAGELVLERWVVALDGEHGVVDPRCDVGLLGLGTEVGPAGLGGNPEDVLGGVLVAALQKRLNLVGRELVALQLGLQGVASRFKGVGDVLEEEQAEDDVLVLRGVHRAAELVGGLPEGVREIQVSALARGLFLPRHAVGFLSWSIGVRTGRREG